MAMKTSRIRSRAALLAAAAVVLPMTLASSCQKKGPEAHSGPSSKRLTTPLEPTVRPTAKPDPPTPTVRPGQPTPPPDLPR